MRLVRGSSVSPLVDIWTICDAELWSLWRRRDVGIVKIQNCGYRGLIQVVSLSWFSLVTVLVDCKWRSALLSSELIIRWAIEHRTTKFLAVSRSFSLFLRALITRRTEVCRTKVWFQHLSYSVLLQEQTMSVCTECRKACGFLVEFYRIRKRKLLFTRVIMKVCFPVGSSNCELWNFSSSFHCHNWDAPVSAPPFGNEANEITEWGFARNLNKLQVAKSSPCNPIHELKCRLLYNDNLDGM
jgi:hypothetical protein